MTCARTGKRRRIVLTADDFSIRSGHADGSIMEKTLYVEELALKLRLPVVKLVDGSSGGGSVTTIRKTSYSYIPHNFCLEDRRGAAQCGHTESQRCGGARNLTWGSESRVHALQRHGRRRGHAF